MHDRLQGDMGGAPESGAPRPQTVAVVIPALNERATIVAAIRSAWSGGADQVIVADGGSTDETSALATAEDANVIDAPRGRGQQLNAGLQQVTAEIVILLHADSRLCSTAIPQVREAMRDNQRVASGAFWQRIEARGMAYRAIEVGNRLRAGWLGLAYGDQAIFARRSVFESIGGVPELPIMEDVALSRRLARAGESVILPGPVFISPRRWQKHGVIRQSFRNWAMLTAYCCGASPQFLSRFYTRHDVPVQESERMIERDDTGL